MPKNKVKRVKGWAIKCTKHKRIVCVLPSLDKAKHKKEDLDAIYASECLHRIVPCEIVLKLSPIIKKK